MAKKTLFYEVFVGEYVRLISKTIVSEQIQTEESMTNQEQPILFDGYLLDVDEEYYFLGETDAAIDRAIDKKEISGVAIHSPEDGFAVPDKGEVH